MGNMPLFPDALVNAFLGYGVVFIGLILLMAVVVIMGNRSPRPGGGHPRRVRRPC